jgi:hypothetical protein
MCYPTLNHGQTSIYARIQVEGHAAPRQGRGLGGISVSAAGHQIHGVWACTAMARHVEKGPRPKMAPDIFLAPVRQKGRPT